MNGFREAVGGQTAFVQAIDKLIQQETGGEGLERQLLKVHLLELIQTLQVLEHNKTLLKHYKKAL